MTDHRVDIDKDGDGNVKGKGKFLLLISWLLEACARFREVAIRFFKVGNNNNKTIHGKKKQKIKKKNRKNRNRKKTNSEESENGILMKIWNSLARFTNTCIDGVYKIMCFYMELPRKLNEKESVMKMLNSLGIAFLAFSITSLLPAVSCRLYLAANPEKLHLARLATLTNSFVILIFFVFIFSMLLFLATQNFPCSDRRIKIARIIGKLLLIAIFMTFVNLITFIYSVDITFQRDQAA